MSYKSASGYGGLEATPLAQIGYYNQIIAQAWERDFLPEITNTEIDERLVACNQKVQFVRQPKVGKWRRYEKNQELIANQLTPEGFELEICNMAYQDIKIDKLDVKRACERWASWEESFLESTYQSLTEEWRTWVLTAMVLETSPENKGNNAGVRGDVQLGQPGSPLLVTPTNVQRAFARLKRILVDRHRWEENKMFVVIPTALSEVLSMSDYAKANWMGDCVSCSINIDGLMPRKLWGFNVIESTYAPSNMDNSGELAYYIIAGHREAFAFCADIIEGRLVTPSRTFGIEYQMLAVWGGKAIYDDALAVGYWTFGE
jgi:hypothetical protein